MLATAFVNSPTDGRGSSCALLRRRSSCPLTLKLTSDRSSQDHRRRSHVLPPIKQQSRLSYSHLPRVRCRVSSDRLLRCEFPPLLGFRFACPLEPSTKDTPLTIVDRRPLCRRHQASLRRGAGQRLILSRQHHWSPDFPGSGRAGLPPSEARCLGHASWLCRYHARSVWLLCMGEPPTRPF